MTSGLPQIPYETQGFPSGTITDGVAELAVSWDDILWAAVTVGRPNRHYVFRHGDASVYEAIFRWSLVRMALEQSSLWSSRLRRTGAAKTLDPTEKGAVNYFLGMTFCKLFAAKLLNTPWLLHLDVFRPQLDPILTGRSRPDLVGKVLLKGVWHAFECKGRVSPPSPDAKTKAKRQASRLTSVNGIPCSLHVGAISYFRSDTLQFFWRDPAPERRSPIVISRIENAWRHYYSPIVSIFSETDRQSLTTYRLVEVSGLDLKVGIHPAIASHLFRNEWDAAHSGAEQIANEIAEAGYQPDGLLVKAGDTWRKPFEDAGKERQ